MRGGRGKFKKFASYVKWWRSKLNLSHYNWYVNRVLDQPENEFGLAAASAELFPTLNMVVIEFYPQGETLDDDELWNTACHEVLHIATDPYVYFMRRQAKLAPELKREETVVLEGVIDNLASQLSKLLTKPVSRSKIIVLKGDSDELSEHDQDLSTELRHSASLRKKAA